MARREKGKNPNAVALGRLGGTAAAGRGGRTRWSAVPADERSQLMRAVARARWAKKRRAK
jgi:hypothetical protein